MTACNAAILQSGNLFMFTVHNPVRWIDPSGLNLRAFAEANNGTILWNETTRTATVTVNGVTQQFRDGDPGVRINRYGTRVVNDTALNVFNRSPQLGAGNWFISSAGAATNFAVHNNTPTFTDNRERGSYIFQRNFDGVTLYTYLNMPPGGHNHVIPHAVFGGGSDRIVGDDRGMRGDAMAFVHTHPSCYCHSGTTFSLADEWLARRIGTTVYLAGTHGNLYAFDSLGGRRPDPVATGLPLPTHRFPRPSPPRIPPRT